MDKKTVNAIIKTFCYYEVFSYPLSFPELSKYLISPKKVSNRELLFTLSKYRSLFEEEKGFLALKNSKKTISERLSKIPESRKKLAKALWISEILSHIPTIQLIGISGSLSMYNASKNDDIDLFFITSKKSLWVTRFLVVITLFILRQKRSTFKNFVRDKICPNMFMTENTLSIDRKNRNIYTAHEVAQLKVIYEKNSMKEKFFSANKWVLRYMPHAFSPKRVKTKVSKNSLLVNILDILFFQIQKFYMRKRKTIEVVKREQAFFHPTPMGNAISEMYQIKVLHRKKMLEKVEITVPAFLRAN